MSRKRSALTRCAGLDLPEDLLRQLIAARPAYEAMVRRIPRGRPYAAEPGDIIPEWRAKSSRNAGRHQIGLMSDIIPDSGATSSGISTHLCIRVLRDRPQGLRERFNAEADALCISTVALSELLHGAGKSAKPAENRREVERFAARLEILPFDADAAAHAAEIRVVLKRCGQTIGAYDLLIAGHARSRGLVVVTANLGEFSRVDGLRREDWFAKAGNS